MEKKTTWMLSLLLLSASMYAQDYSMVKLKPINNGIDLKLESCIRDGNSVTITYYLRNNTGKDFVLNYLGTLSSYCGENVKGENTLVVDNLGQNYIGNGYEYNTYQELAGVKKNDLQAYIDVTLPNDIWMKGIYVMRNVNPAAESFQMVKLAFTQ